MRASGRRKEAEEIIERLKEIDRTHYVISNGELRTKELLCSSSPKFENPKFRSVSFAQEFVRKSWVTRSPLPPLQICDS